MHQFQRTDADISLRAVVNSITASRTAGEFLRFAIVGVISNGVLFALYLAVVALGMGHKSAATLAYAIGLTQTFAFNKSWSFRNRGALGPAFGRYIAVYAVGYLVNMVVLVTFVDHLGLRHQWVQGSTILILAAVIFLLQKYWVFPVKANDSK